MFTLGINYKYWLYSKPTDMRKSFHSLSGIVTSIMHKQLTNGNVFIFINARRNRIKLLHYEEGGMVIYSKLIENGKMKQMQIQEGNSIDLLSLHSLIKSAFENPNIRRSELKIMERMCKNCAKKIC